MKEIRKIIEAYDNINFNSLKAALASVVNVEESSYRRIGARMLVLSNGAWIGGISGGCLEGDALKRSQKAIFNNAPSRVIYDTMDDDSNQIGIGLGCNGRIEVVFNPIDADDPLNEIEILRKTIDRDTPSVLIKIIESNSIAEWLGSSTLSENISHSGLWDLSIAQLDPIIKQVLENRKSTIANLTTSSNLPLKLLIEYIRPELKLFIIGDNYDVAAMVDIATILGWQPFIVGKVKKLGKDVFEKAKMVVDYNQLKSLPVDNYSAVILMTHDYNKDKELLPYLISQKPGYLGMLGPKKRMVKMQKELGDLDLSSIKNFYSPVGLEIGAESPEEIALSISAEIVSSFRNKPGGSLKYKEGTIHERE